MNSTIQPYFFENNLLIKINGTDYINKFNNLGNFIPSNTFTFPPGVVVKDIHVFVFVYRQINNYTYDYDVFFQYKFTESNFQALYKAYKRKSSDCILIIQININ